MSDLERVAGSFNEMAGAIASDVGAHERAELQAVDARQAAEHANRAKSTFLAAMSHELRTPMIGVTGMLEVLAQSDGRDGRQLRAAPPRCSTSSCRRRARISTR